MRYFKKLKAKGFTLVEALVTVAMVGILAGVATPYLGEILQRRRVEMVARELASDIKYAYSLSRSYSIGVQVALLGSCYNVQRITGMTPCFCASNSFNGAVAGAGICAPSTNGAPSIFGGIAKTVEMPRSSIQLQPSTDITSAFGGVRPVIAYLNDGSVQPYAPPRAYVDVSGGGSLQLRVLYGPFGQTRICAVNGNFSGYPSCQSIGSQL